jgi:hypothetical protein
MIRAIVERNGKHAAPDAVLADAFSVLPERQRSSLVVRFTDASLSIIFQRRGMYRSLVSQYTI